MAVALSVASAASAGQRAAGSSTPAVHRTSAVPSTAPSGADAVPTPAGPRRARTPAAPQALALAAAARLASPACATHAHALAGRYPAVVLARGSGRAPALVAQSVAAALLGLPVEVPQAARPARERLDAALARLSRSLSAGDDGAATATAAAMRPRIAAYAAALGIGDCA